MAVLINKIDELTEDDHYHITKDDKCYYFIEYPSGNAKENLTNPDYSYIHNFKKTLDRKGTQQWYWKGDAISKTITLFEQFFRRQNTIGKHTLVPIPPSKNKSNPLYDDRMSQVLSSLAKKFNNADFRELILTKEDMAASHETSVRPTIQEIKSNYLLDVNLIDGCRKSIILFDDVLTSGTHFCAARELISERIPNCSVKGIFIARRILPNPAFDFDDDFELVF